MEEYDWKKSKLQVLRMIESEYITKYKDAETTGSYSNLQEVDSSLGKLTNYTSGLSFDNICEILIKISLEVGFIHKYSIIHGDIKENSIYTSKNSNGNCNYTIKLGDFDFDNEEKTKKSDVKGIGDILSNLLASNPGVEQNNKEFKYLKRISDVICGKKEEEMPEVEFILQDNFIMYKAKFFGLFEELFKILGESPEYKGEEEDDRIGEVDMEFIKKFLKDKAKSNFEIERKSKSKSKKIEQDIVGMDDFNFNEEDDNKDGIWDYKEFEIGPEGKKFEYHPPHGWCAIGIKLGKKDAKEEEGKIPVDTSNWPIAYHGLRPIYLPVGPKIKGIVENRLKQGPNQDKQYDENVLHNEIGSGETCGKGITHYYDLRHVIYNQNTGPEKLFYNKEEKDFLFAFMCRVNPDKITQPYSNPTQWLLEMGEDTEPFRLLFKNAKVTTLLAEKEKDDGDDNSDSDDIYG